MLRSKHIANPLRAGSSQTHKVYRVIHGQAPSKCVLDISVVLSRVHATRQMHSSALLNHKTLNSRQGRCIVAVGRRLRCRNLRLFANSLRVN